MLNDERIDRGLAPIAYMTAQLNAYAQAGANANTDPSFPSTLSGGAALSGGGAIWGGGITSVARGRLLLDVLRRLGRLGGGDVERAVHLGLQRGLLGPPRRHLARLYACAGGVAPTLSMGAASATTSAAVPWPPSWSAPAGRPPPTSPSAGTRSPRGPRAPESGRPGRPAVWDRVLVRLF